MQTRSDTWAALAIRGRFKTEVKAVINGVEYTQISAPVISQALFSGSLSVGNVNSASCRFGILTTDNIPSGAQVKIKARIYSGETYSEWREFGTFYIDQRSIDTTTGLITLQCYDAMMKANQQYVDPTQPNVRLGWPHSMAWVVDDIAEKLGVEVDARTVIHTGDAYQVPFPASLSIVSTDTEGAAVQMTDCPTNYTIKDVLGFIAACHAGNWIITPENQLRLVPLVSLPSETYDIIDFEYNKIHTNTGDKLIWKEYTPGPEVTNESGGGLINVPVVIGKIKTMTPVIISGVSMTKESGTVYKAGTFGSSVLAISCPYSSQAICNDIYTAYSGLEYRPFSISTSCYDPCTELGDWVLVGDRVRSFLASQVVTFSHDIRIEAGAPGRDETGSEYPYLTEIQRMKLESENLRLYTETAQKETYSKIEQTKESILLGVYEKLGNEYVAYSDITITSSGISLSHGSLANNNLVQVSMDMSGTGIALSYKKGGTGSLESGLKDIITTSDFALGDNGITMSFMTRDAQGHGTGHIVDFLTESSFVIGPNGTYLTYTKHTGSIEAQQYIDIVTSNDFVVGDHGLTFNYEKHSSTGAVTTGSKEILTSASIVAGENGIVLYHGSSTTDVGNYYLTENNFVMNDSGIVLSHTKNNVTSTLNFSESYLMESNFTMNENGITLSHSKNGVVTTKILSTASYLTEADFTMSENGITLRHGTTTKKFDSSSYLTSADFTMTANGITLSHGTTTKSFDSSSYLTSADFTMSSTGITLRHGTTTKSFDSSSYVTAADFTMTSSGITLSHGTTTKTFDSSNYVVSSDFTMNANGITLTHTNSANQTTTKTFDATSFVKTASLSLTSTGFSLSYSGSNGVIDTKSLTLDSKYAKKADVPYSADITASATGLKLTWQDGGGTNHNGTTVTMSNQLSIESGDISITGNRIAITSTNFTLTKTGAVTASSFTGTGSFTTSSAALTVNGVSRTASAKLNAAYLYFYLDSSVVGSIGTRTMSNATKTNLGIMSQGDALTLGVGSSSYYIMNNGADVNNVTQRHYFIGDMYISNGLKVSGGAILNGGTTISNGLEVTGGLTVKQNKLILETTSGSTTYTTEFWMTSTGNLSLSNGLYADGTITATGRINTSSGNIYTNGGNIYTESGTIYTKSGDLRSYAGTVGVTNAAGTSWVAEFTSSGDMICVGTKSRVVGTDSYGVLKLFALETPTPIFSDMGSGECDETGEAYVFMDPEFLETIEARHDYQVFLTQTSEHEIYRVSKQDGYFIVYGDPYASFDWAVYYKQRDYDALRLESFDEDIEEDLVYSEEEFQLEEVLA